MILEGLNEVKYIKILRRIGKGKLVPVLRRMRMFGNAVVIESVMKVVECAQYCYFNIL